MANRCPGESVPQVSVILATCRNSPYLSPALQSLVSQTFPNWEFIVVMDGAPEPERLAETIRSRVPRARVLIDNRRGLPSARNLGLTRALGDFVVFMDDDDVWSPTKLERQVELLSRRPELLACHHLCSLIDREGTLIPGSIGKAIDRRALLRFDAHWAFPAFMVRREAVSLCGGFNPHYPLSEDLAFLLALVDWGEIGFIDEVLMQYRKYSASQTGDVASVAKANVLVLRDRMWAAERVGDTATARLVKRGIDAQRNWASDTCYASGIAALKGGKYREAAVMLAKAASFDWRTLGKTIVRECLGTGQRVRKESTC
jgi:glycosyltransferase involved in cell wall biosynthesis